MKYTFPDLQNSSLAYKGRRFWIIEIAEGDTFDSYITKADAEYIVYDAKYQELYGHGFSATISKTPSGKFLVSPSGTHVDMSFEIETFRDIAKPLPKVIEDYMKTCFG